jgi:hypothetical protein
MYVYMHVQTHIFSLKNISFGAMVYFFGHNKNSCTKVKSSSI